MAFKTRMQCLNAINDSYEFIKDFAARYSDACKQYGGTIEQREIEANLSYLVSNMAKEEYGKALEEMDWEGLEQYYHTVVVPLVIRLRGTIITTSVNTEMVSVNRFDDRSIHSQAGIIEENTTDWKPSVAQWNQVTSRSFYETYQATRKNTDPSKMNDPIEDYGKELDTECNGFVKAVLEIFGQKVVDDLLPKSGTATANELYTFWSKNENGALKCLENKTMSWQQAQEAADAGFLVLSATSNPDGHVAFVLPRIYASRYQTIPARDWKQREGYDPRQEKIDYDEGIIKKNWPAFLQAGTYTGIVPPTYAYNTEMIDAEEIYFFVYAGRKNE